jgi:hypothetical protein
MGADNTNEDAYYIAHHSSDIVSHYIAFSGPDLTNQLPHQLSHYLTNEMAQPDHTFVGWSGH